MRYMLCKSYLFIEEHVRHGMCEVTYGMCEGSIAPGMGGVWVWRGALPMLTNAKMFTQQGVHGKDTAW